MAAGKGSSRSANRIKASPEALFRDALGLAPAGSAPRSEEFPLPPAPTPTGRLLVLLQPGLGAPDAKRMLKEVAGARTVSAREVSEPGDMAAALAEDAAVVFERFGIAVIPADGTGRATALGANEAVRQVRPEFYMHAISVIQARYDAWLHEGLRLLLERDGIGIPAAVDAAVASALSDTDEWTWGLQAVGAHRTPFTGRGIRVAVLDTGIDLDHPDFKKRAIVTKSFVAGVGMPDMQGHGTHTAGTLAGPAQPSTGRRYGVAPDVELHVGKVLGDNGSGLEADILAGMNWALDQGCAVISMSLGRAAFPGEEPDERYEAVGTAALAEGSLVIAAAGNESVRKSGYIAPVGAPANSPSILAVAAIDPQFGVASFSCGGINPKGGEVNLAGPGTGIYSAAPWPRGYRVLPGTSMACPHAAGIAALWAQSDANLRGRRLWNALTSSSRALNASARDVGAGLVQAPSGGPAAAASKPPARTGRAKATKRPTS